MAPNTLEERFECYRTHADMRALGSVFDEVAPEMLSVARHLSRSAVDAEDLVQSTFLAVLKDPDSFDASRRLRPWLLGVLANFARRARERSRRVVDPERLDRGEPIDPADAASGAELQGAVEQALADCPPKYAQVLRMHLAEGLRPREMARELALAPGTVRVHLHRGLKLLRDALPAGFAYGAAATVTSGRGLAAVRQEVLSQGARQVRGGPPVKGHGASTAAKATAVAAGGLVFVIAGFSAMLFGGDDEEPLEEIPTPVVQGAGIGTTEPESVTEDSKEELDVAVLPPPVRSARRLALEAEAAELESWRLLETEHYLVITSVLEDTTVQDLLDRLEAIHAVYVVDFPAERLSEDGEPTEKPGEKAIVRFCANAQEYGEYNAPANTLAYWSERETELVLYAREELRLTWMSLYHEAWHQFIYRLCGSLVADTWFAEGIGDHYSGYRYDAGGLTLGQNEWRLETLAKLLAEERFAPLEELTAWGAAEYSGRNRHGLGAGESYAQGWSFAEFLRRGAGTEGWDPSWSTLPLRYLEALAASGDKALARTSAFTGIDWRALEDTWLAYWAGR